MAAALARDVAWRQAGPRLWFLLPATLGRLRPWLAGTGVATAVVLLFLLAATLSGQDPPPLRLDAPDFALAAFFTASLGLLAGLSQLVFASARLDYEALRPLSVANSATLSAMGEALQRLPWQNVLSSIAPALLFAAGHVLLLGATVENVGVQLASWICTALLWLAMFQLAVPLIDNARLFSLLGGTVQVNLYRPAELTSFGRAAIRPCLLIIALQCAYALLILPEEVRFGLGSSMGLIASMGLVAALFFLPLRGIRHNIALHKAQALTAIDAELAALPQPGQTGPQARELARAGNLLLLRDRLAAVSTWPLGLAGVSRFLFYLVLVPLTWVGAALVEMAMDGRL